MPDHLIMFAQRDGEAIGAVVFIGVLAAASYALLQMTRKMEAIKDRLLQWAKALGVVAGIAWFGACLFEGGSNPDIINLAMSGFGVGMIVFFFLLTLFTGVSFIWCHGIEPVFSVLARILRGMFGWIGRIFSWFLSPPLNRTTPHETDQEEHKNRQRNERELLLRKQNARASCELVFALHASEIEKRFTRKMFDDFVKKYMGDDQPPEVVEQRAFELKQVIQQHREKVSPTPQVSNVEDLTRWFIAEKARIEGLEIDGPLKKNLLVQLNERFAELSSQMLEKMGP